MGDDEGASGSGGFDLAAQLGALNLDADVFTDYVSGIMDDDTGTPLEERVESVLGILGSATEEPLEAFGAGLRRYWEQREAEAAAAQAAGPPPEKAAEVQAFQARLEAEKRAAEEEARRQAAELHQRQRDQTEVRDREALLTKYGFDGGDSGFDEDGNVLSGSGSGSGVDAELGAILGGGNSNKAQVAEAARLQREAAKVQHAKKVEREKELLLKQKAKKEAEKRRTQKQEKRRGCG